MKINRYVWMYFLCGVASGFTSENDSSRALPILESSHVELLRSEQGVVKYRLLTEKALHYENGDRVYPEGMHMVLYESDQEVSMTGKANSVYFCAKENVYEFKGDVELKSLREKRQLNTEALYWNPESEIFYTDKFIKMEAENKLLTGDGLVAKQDLSYYTISKPRGLFNVKVIK
jgi:LPS export ABC transporter protein LptC